jgi:DNA-binding NtrC family response regulator
MKRANVLIVDDEKNIRRTLSLILEGEGYACHQAATAAEAVATLDNEPIDILLLDIRLPDQDGLSLLKRLSERGLEIPVLIITGHGTIADAVTATRLGAYHLIQKPIDREVLLTHIRNCEEKVRLERELATLRELAGEEHELIGGSRVMQELREQIARVAASRAKVLITGESGTGKELVARAIHRLSPLADKPFVKVNCAAIPDDLLESELFGHVRGAFTGARTSRRGKFELANGGTIFLDEIGDLSLAAQAKVLRALQTGEILPVGGEKRRIVSVRALAATNKDLPEEIRKGNFREDLYYRINVVPIHTPPLREHLEDIPLLAEYFIAHFCALNGVKPKRITRAAILQLQSYNWPGNVRELRNIIERMVILAGEVIDVDQIPVPPALQSGRIDPREFSGLPLKDAVRNLERTMIIRSLESTNWNVRQAAKLLGIERSNLHKKMKQFGIKRERGDRA